MFQNGWYLDLVSRGCSKGKGIHIIKKAYSLEVVAGAGDFLNNLPMFEAVDVSYVMRQGNLSADLRDHWIDSLYEALEKSI